MNINDKNLLNELVVESKEHLTTIEPDLLSLEKDTNVPKETINRIFRAVHSIKGGFSFFGMEKIKELSHTMENVMMKVRDGELEVTTEIVDALFAGVDKLGAMIDDVYNSEQMEISTEVEKFRTIVQQQPSILIDKETGSVLDALSKLTISTLPVSDEKLASIARQGLFLYVMLVLTRKDLEEKERSPIDVINELAYYGEFLDSWVDLSEISGLDDCTENEIGFIIIYSSVLEPDLLDPIISIDRSQIKTFTKDDIRIKNESMQTSEKKKQPVTSTEKKAPSQSTPQKTSLKPAPAPPPASSKTTKTELHHTDSSESIRVKVKLLNSLVNLAGELVLSRNQLIQQLKNVEESGLKAVLNNVDMVTSELQENIMSTRMQPLSSIFGKFPRLVRDLSRSLNKEVELSLQGENVELDKSIIEALTDPLTHLIRNCVDHGIENPAIRTSSGKPPTGHILLRAYHEGGQVNIEIKDDGGGIAIDRVKQKAINNGIIRAEDAETLQDQEVFDLLFEPGFSTSEKVTEVSGRGVGMDVVRTNIENLAGNIEIASEQLKGTTITLRLPLTLAIIPALIVACQERRFAIPQVSLDELVRLQANNASRKIEKIQGKDVLRLRDKLLPVIRLSDVLKINPQYTDPETAIKMSDRRNNIADRRQNSDNSDDDQRIATKDRRQSVQSAINIVVLKESGHQYGLIVDRMVDSEEIVVKPLSGYLKNCKCYSGATIMGDGRVAMILDASGITELANLRFNDLLEEEQRHSETVRSESIKEAQTYLLFRNKGSEFLALNLSLVSRIETISQNDIENIGNKEYLKYDNYSMRVIRPSNFMPVRQSESQNGTSYVIIPKLVKHPIGIITDVVLDVVESSATIDTTNITGTGVQGSMTVDDKLVIIIDIYSLFETAEPDIYKTTINTSNLNGKKILLAEDTSFFKTLECNYLESMGCVVDTVDNGKQAMEKLSNDSYDLVLTDIQMPIMNGIELTRQIKKIPGLQNMPIIALTSLQDEKTEQLCLEAGTNAYEQKLDKEKLITTLNNIFEKTISGK